MAAGIDGPLVGRGRSLRVHRHCSCDVAVAQVATNGAMNQPKQLRYDGSSRNNEESNAASVKR
eukprot:421160-Alexandrium_andersonii.AAC.1